MKNITLLVLLLGLFFNCFADYTDTVRTYQNELNFSTVNGYDAVSLSNGLFTDEIGAPQLPVKK
jgi:hypothetical protein